MLFIIISAIYYLFVHVNLLHELLQLIRFSSLNYPTKLTQFIRSNQFNHSSQSNAAERRGRQGIAQSEERTAFD